MDENDRDEIPVTAENTGDQLSDSVHASEHTDGEDVEPDVLSKDNGLPYPNSRGVFRVKLE